MQRKARGTARRRVPARKKAEIGTDADVLASKMAGLHGGKWAVDVDHRAGFIMIRQRRDRLDNVSGRP